VSRVSEFVKVDPNFAGRYPSSMNAIEFTTELSEKPVLTIPSEIAQQLPKAGKARVIVITNSVADDDEWQAAAYEQFLPDDTREDAVYYSERE